MKKVIKQKWTPKYPETMFVYTSTFIDSDGMIDSIITWSWAYKTKKEIADYAVVVKKEMTRLGKEHKLTVGGSYVTTLKLAKVWELKPEYWTGNHMEHSDIRSKLFVRMFLNRERDDDWQVLITPSGRKGKREMFSAAIPVKTEKASADVEAFMRYSNFSVDPTATHAALYKVEETARLST